MNPNALPSSLARPLHALAVGSLWAMLLLAILAGSGAGFPVWPAGIAAWLGGLALWPRLDYRQRRQCLLLAGVGAAALVAASLRGEHSGWLRVLTQNTTLLAMLAAVSFLQLLGIAHKDETPPQGRAALWRTLFGVHILGSVINMSAVFLMAERLARSSPLTPAQAALLVRGFLAAALWSPFFAAMAVALTYAPGATLGEVALVGAPFAVLLLCWAGYSLIRELPERGANFVGYPMDWSALWVPLLLALLVGAGHAVLTTWESLAIISACALGLSIAVCAVRLGRVGAAHALVRHSGQRLPAMSGEVALFLAAAVFASGLQALMASGLSWLPFTRFGIGEAALLLALMMGLAMIGVHAVVSIAMASAWLAPLQPDPILLALVFLQTWAIGLAASPLSGVHLALQARFGLSASSLAHGNARYCLAAYLGAVCWLTLIGGLRGSGVGFPST